MVIKTSEQQSRYSGVFVLCAGMVLMLILGSIHAFSVFLEPLETSFAASRTAVSATYSLALGFLTLSVLFGHHIYQRLHPEILVAVICILGATGCALASVAESLPMVWLGYSVLFGIANGVGYGFVLQISAQANPQWKGLAMGIITACYALGAVMSPLFFNVLLINYGFAGAMKGLAICLVSIIPITYALLIRADIKLQILAPLKSKDSRSHKRLVIKLWIGYGSAVAAGLIAIGHATGIARSNGLDDWWVLSAPIIIAAFNMAGSLIGGNLADKISTRKVLILFPALSSCALFGLVAVESTLLVLSALAIIGFCYGATIAAYPAFVGRVFGSANGIRIYGRIFTAWGIAGLVGPVLAGYLYEFSGNYELTLILAGCTGLVSLITVWSLSSKNLITSV